MLFNERSEQKKIYNCLHLNLQKKIIDPCNAKEHYQSFLRNENTTPVKQSKTIIKEPELRKTNKIIELKQVNIEHPEYSHKLTKTIKETEKVSEIVSPGKKINNPLYSDTTKRGKVFEKKKKLTKRSDAYKV